MVYFANKGKQQIQLKMKIIAGCGLPFFIEMILIEGLGVVE
jgi:hypothetical protein